MSEEALQIAEERRGVKGKGERERYTQLNGEFQRITRRDKKDFLNKQCKVVKENNRIGKTRDLFKKTGDIKGTFHARMSMIKNRNVKDLIEAEDIKKRWQEYTDVLVTQSCLTLCDPLCYIAHWSPLSLQEHWSGLPFSPLRIHKRTIQKSS